MAFIFDGPIRTITLTAGTVEMSVPALYSAWVDWVATSDNAKYLPAFRTVGGDVVDAVAGTTIPAYCYLINGWHIHPQMADHTLNVTGGILLRDGGGDPFEDVPGYTIRINYSQPVQAITVATGGGSGAAWTDTMEGDLSYGESMRLQHAVLVGLTEIVNNIVKFKGADGTTDRVTATMTGSQRTSVVLNPD
jgi:hypothetical protein